MIATSRPNASIRRDSWRRRSARAPINVPGGICQPEGGTVDLARTLIHLSRGSIDWRQAHSLLAMAQGDRAVEIVIDRESGEVVRLTMIGGRRSTADATDAA